MSLVTVVYPEMHLHFFTYDTSENHLYQRTLVLLQVLRDKRIGNADDKLVLFVADTVCPGQPCLVVWLVNLEAKFS